MHASTQAWILSRYKKTCPACAKRFHTSPRTLPTCPGCWNTLPKEVCLWWWASKRPEKTLHKLLDEWFDGGYDVPFDVKQAPGYRCPYTGVGYDEEKFKAYVQAHRRTA